MWGLEPDIVTVGQVDRRRRPAGRVRHDRGGRRRAASVRAAATTRSRSVATGGTLFGNPLSMAAARATMGEVLTDEAYAHTHALGARARRRPREAIAEAGLPWTAHRFWPRSG